MAIYYSQILLLYSSFIYCFLILKTEALTFNLTNIGSDQHQNFNITGFPDAYVSSQGLQLTSDASNVSQGISGKATYIDPLHLWDNSTRNLTDFYTHFTFVIDSRGATEFADGIAFFLAPNGSNSTADGAIGLPLTQDWSKPTSPFVAVEFDTYQNVAVDPLNISPVTHVGIDVNSVKSYVTAVWYCNITHGIENEAWIWYDSSSKNLSVVFTSSTITTRVEDTIHLIVDLRYYLPEWVTFEFSAATRQLFETNAIKSWEFTSSLQNNYTKKNVTPPMKPICNKTSHQVVAGSVAGSVVLVVFGLLKRSRAKEENKSGIGPEKFSYGQLYRTTNNFDEEQKLGGEIWRSL